jgi:hypothetical protein
MQKPPELPGYQGETDPQSKVISPSFQRFGSIFTGQPASAMLWQTALQR